MSIIRPLFSALPFFLASAAGLQAAPHWIWIEGRQDDAPVYFRHTFEVTAASPEARLALSCDNQAEVFLNGKSIGKTAEWEEPLKVKVGSFLQPGKNTIAVLGQNRGGAAAMVARVDSGDGKTILTESGGEWKVSSAGPAGWETPGFDDAGWKGSKVIAELGAPPWGNALARSAPGTVDVDSLNLLPGFKAELVYTVPKGNQGSWVSLTLDDRQRLIAGDQNGGLYRITLKDGGSPEVEALTTKTGNAQGLLFANHALYVVRNGGESGLYRLRDTNGDDQFDEEVLLRKLDGAGEHGPHAVVLAPDGKSLYVVAGNFTKIPEPEISRVPRLWGEDQLITRLPDANGHDPHVMAPAGWVAHTDFDGKSWELQAMGFRNSYDIAFNRAGELFTYDSDMEWDIGLPWYRPTRVCHVVGGADFGFRNGSGKFPTYYPDSVPPVLNIGPGSPTGVLFGYGAKFPAKYQNALYILDWTYGTMYAIHLSPDGATFSGEKEEFISGKPLPLTDALIRPADGAMYFLIGGRGNQSALYRVTWTGAQSTAPDLTLAPVTPEMKLRRDLEALQTAAPSAFTIGKVWRYLDHADRFVRFAARSVVEMQPVSSWKSQALGEKRPWGRLSGLLALARAADGDQTLLIPILHSLGELAWADLSEEQQLALIRTASVALIRLGPLDAEGSAVACKRLDPLFPSPSAAVNRELCALLVKLGSRQIVAKTVAQLGAVAQDSQMDLGNADLLARSEGYAQGVLGAQSSRPNRQQTALAYSLREADAGWSPELRAQYFRWYNTALKYQGGNSLHGFIENMRKAALARVPEDQRAGLDSIAGELTTTPEELPKPMGPGKAWTTDELLLLTADGLHGRNFEAGRTAYQAALCSSCHRFGTEYGGVGPDLTGVGSRYTMADLLDNIMEPSKVISDQYESTLIEQFDGSTVVGRIVEEVGDKVSVAQNPLNPRQLTVINQSNIKTRSKYPVSAMPPALLYNLNQDEVLNLLAFLLSGGNADDKAFK